MEVLSQPVVQHVLPLQQLEPAQYLALARKVVEHYGWWVTAQTPQSLTSQTPTHALSQGETITISVTRKNAVFTSISANGYYEDAHQNQQNADRFKAGMEAIIAAYRKADRNLHPMHREKYGALVPSKTYQVTPYLVYANALLFVLMVLAGISPIHPTSESLLLWGGNFRPADLGGEPWRLLSYMFLHAGFMHVFMNMFALLYIGMFLEPLIGRVRFLTLYLATGVVAGLTSIFVHPLSVGVGASGAIFGMYGVFLAILTTGYIQKTLRKTLLRSMLFFIVFNLMTGMQGNTDNAAHIGGLISGMALGYICYPGIKGQFPVSKQVVTSVLVCAATVGLVWGSMLFLGHR